MPSSPLPPLIMTSEMGTFARQTIEELKANIVDRVLVDYDYTPPIREALLELKAALTSGTIQPLQEATSDKALWDEDTQPWWGKSWLEIPWLLAETYFYRKLLEAVGYFQPGPWTERDPYHRMKSGEIKKSLAPFLADYEQMDDGYDQAGFSNAIAKALWGNRSDLSNLQHYDTDASTHHQQIIRNESETVYQLLKKRPAKIAYFFDNVGREFYFDLAFIQYLIKGGFVESITFYLKNQPFFVSDAMPADYDLILDRLEGSGSDKAIQLAADLKAWTQAGIITVEDPPFLATSRDFQQLPESLSAQLATYDLAILKGDANYRRVIGDRHWDPTIDFADVTAYFPTSVVSLRTLKAELIVGLTSEQLEDFQKNAESDWMINGKRGMISFMGKVKGV